MTTTEIAMVGFIALALLTYWLPVVLFLSVKFARLGWLVAARDFEQKFNKDSGNDEAKA